MLITTDTYDSPVFTDSGRLPNQRGLSRLMATSIRESETVAQRKDDRWIYATLVPFFHGRMGATKHPAVRRLDQPGHVELTARAATCRPACRAPVRAPGATRIPGGHHPAGS